MHDDADLYRRWVESHDEDAFATLARRHAGLVVDVALRTDGDRADAEDALQEALLALARDGTTRPAAVGVRAWLARAAITRARHARASRQARARREQAVGAQREEASMPGPTMEATEAVRGALARLESGDATLLSLRFLHGFEYPELAEAFEVSEPTARVRVHRALAQLRTEARRDDLDERAMGLALAGLPLLRLDDGTVEAAIAAALRPVAPVGPGLLSFRAVAVATAAVAVVGATAWIVHSRSSSTSSPPPRSVAARPDAGPGTDAGVTLVGSADSAAHAAIHAVDPSAGPGADAGAASKAGPPAATPAPAPARRRAAPQDHSRPVTLRLELARVDGSSEEIAIERIIHRGVEWPGTAKGRENVRVEPGSSVVLGTSDPRAAIATVVLPIPNPVPPLLVARVPAKDDPRLARLMLEVVDDISGEPLPDAVLDWGEGAAGTGSLRADAQGRIVVFDPAAAPPAGEGAPEPAIARFLESERHVHAPGHYGSGSTGREAAFAVEADALDRWVATGSLRVALRRLPEVDGLEERTVRIVDAQGRPLEGAYVHISWPVPREMGVWLTGWQDGFRRLGADGLVKVNLLDVVGVGIRLARMPIGVWGLAKESWPASRPRELRLPPLATVEVTLDGLPEEGRASWSFDRLGAMRTPMDGSAYPTLLDEATGRLLVRNETHLADTLPPIGGSLSRPRGTFALQVLVGRTYEIRVDAGWEQRRLELRTDSPGPVRLTRTWADLPLLR